MTRTDSEIQQAVLHELKWDTRVQATEVGVEVDAGIVTLTGVVNSWAKRLAAVQAAHRIQGVLDVANDIEVRLPGTVGHTDTEVAALVRHALECDVLVPAARINSTVSSGWVTLEGAVDYWSQRDDAALAIKNLRAVAGVTNKIDVRPAAVYRYDVQNAIENALDRQAAREAQRITIDVQDSEVILSGSVRSWAERVTVIGAAKGTAGVQNVVDRLKIEPMVGE